MRGSSTQVSISHCLFGIGINLTMPVAYMVAGWNGSEGDAPGFPKDGTWTVKHEGLLKAL